MYKKSLGFTLIEIVVVFAVLAILSTIGIASFVTYNQSQTLNVEEGELKSVFNLAKSRAISQTKPSSCESLVLDGYRINISVLSRSYEMEAVCSGSPHNILSRTLHPDISFGEDTNPVTYFFPVISGGVSAGGTIVLSGYEQEKTITIDSLGGVR